MRFLRAAMLSLVLFWPLLVAAADGAPGPVVVLNIHGPIGPATADYVQRGLARANNMGATLVVLRMDTPGGLDTAMRDIIQHIIASPVPVASLVAPGGARAASAGTYILYASHIAAMAPATNLGAATPIEIGGMPTPAAPEPKPLPDNATPTSKKGGSGEATPTEEPPSAPRDLSRGGDAHKAKQVNDAVAYIRGLAQMRGRNVEWAEKAVREAASLPAKEALALNVIDLMASDVPELLTKLDGRTVNVMGRERVLHTAGAEVVRIEPDWRNRLLSVITDPNILPILMTLGVFGLIYEMLNPGYVLPGVLGGICLLLALYAAQVLPVNYAGLGLIALGVAFMIAEAFVPSFGALGIGGVVAFVIGSVILIETDTEGYGVSIPLIATAGVVNALLFGGVATLALRARSRRVVSGAEELIGGVAEALEDFDREGRVRIHSELWTARSNTPVHRGDRLRVVSMDGLTLNVQTESPPKEN
jgi:membrane-bound serine protease (ClpP class)